MIFESKSLGARDAGQEQSKPLQHLRGIWIYGLGLPFRGHTCVIAFGAENSRFA